MKYQCYYFEPVFIGGVQHKGMRHDVACFDKEYDADRYCSSHVEFANGPDGEVECEIMYEEVEN